MSATDMRTWASPGWPTPAAPRFHDLHVLAWTMHRCGIHRLLHRHRAVRSEAVLGHTVSLG